MDRPLRYIAAAGGGTGVVGGGAAAEAAGPSRCRFGTAGLMAGNVRKPGRALAPDPAGAAGHRTCVPFRSDPG